MRLYEIKVTKELFDFKTYYELIQTLESINFQSASQLNDTIQEIRGELKKYEDDEEDDGWMNDCLEILLFLIIKMNILNWIFIWFEYWLIWVLCVWLREREWDREIQREKS